MFSKLYFLILFLSKKKHTVYGLLVLLIYRLQTPTCIYILHLTASCNHLITCFMGSGQFTAGC